MKRYTLMFVGCGSGIYSELGNNNVLLESSDKANNLLVDCGFATAPMLERDGRLASIRNALVTHVHSDHVGGFEYWAYLNRYVWRQRPKLFYHRALHDEFWAGSLRGGLEKSQDEAGAAEILDLSDYFAPEQVDDDAVIGLEGLPEIRLSPTLHVAQKPSYSLFLGETVYFSGDTCDLPPSVGPTGKPLTAIFQDCQLFEGPSNVHISIFQLDRGLPPDLKAITHLMHYGRNHETFHPEQMGFAGFVRPGQAFELPL